jgi:hypothetical protein
VGQLCAFLFGVLLGALAMDQLGAGDRGARVRTWGRSLGLAGLGGAGLAVANLTVALTLGLPQVEAEVAETIDKLGEFAFTNDPDMLHRPLVVTVLVAGLVAFPLWALLGVGASVLAGPRRSAVFGLAWYPVSIVGWFFVAKAADGAANVVLPFYGNDGSGWMVWSWGQGAAIASTLVLAACSGGLCLVAFRRTRPVRSEDSPTEPATL